MNTELLITFSPFLTVLYIAFALIQALRKKQQGIGAALLAFIGLAVPFAALMLSQDATVQSTIANNLTLNAVIIFVASIVILLIERGNPVRGVNRSYGMLGIGVGVLLAVGIFAYPLLAGSSTDTTTTDVAGIRSTLGDTSTLQNVAIDTTTEASAFTLVVAEQTGLSTEEITTQLEAGSTVAELVTANSGNVDAVIEAAVTALDDLKSQEGMPAQMLANLEGDNNTIAAQLVQGELEQRMQQLLTAVLLGGGMPARPDGTAGGAFSPSGAGAASTDQNAPANTAGQGAGQIASQPTAQPTTSPATPTEVVIRPTVISFPSVTPTPVAVVSAEAADEANDTLATCSITVIYNLNLRDQPSTDSTVYLSIPFGTSVVSDGRTADNWYHVSYDGQAGWVSGEYVTADAACDDIAVVDVN